MRNIKFDLYFFSSNFLHCFYIWYGMGKKKIFKSSFHQKREIKLSSKLFRRFWLDWTHQNSNICKQNVICSIELLAVYSHE